MVCISSCYPSHPLKFPVVAPNLKTKPPCSVPGKLAGRAGCCPGFNSESLHLLFFYDPPSLLRVCFRKENQGVGGSKTQRLCGSFSDTTVLLSCEGTGRAQLLHRLDKYPKPNFGLKRSPLGPHEGSRAKPLPLLPPAAPPPTPDAPLPTSFQGRGGGGLCHLGLADGKGGDVWSLWSSCRSSAVVPWSLMGVTVLAQVWPLPRPLQCSAGLREQDQRPDQRPGCWLPWSLWQVATTCGKKGLLLVSRVTFYDEETGDHVSLERLVFLSPRVGASPE